MVSFCLLVYTIYATNVHCNPKYVKKFVLAAFLGKRTAYADLKHARKKPWTTLATHKGEAEKKKEKKDNDGGGAEENAGFDTF